MAWQDWVFSVGGMLVLVSLIPTIRAKEKPALTTSIMTSLLVVIFATTMLTLGLWLSAATNYCISAAWGLLAWQAYRIKASERHESVIDQIEEELLHSLPHALIEHDENELRHVGGSLVVTTKAGVDD